MNDGFITAVDIEHCVCFVCVFRSFFWLTFNDDEVFWSLVCHGWQSSRYFLDVLRSQTQTNHMVPTSLFKLVSTILLIEESFETWWTRLLTLFFFSKKTKRLVDFDERRPAAHHDIYPIRNVDLVVNNSREKYSPPPLKSFRWELKNGNGNHQPKCVVIILSISSHLSSPSIYK